MKKHRLGGRPPVLPGYLMLRDLEDRDVKWIVARASEFLDTGEPTYTYRRIHENLRRRSYKPIKVSADSVRNLIRQRDPFLARRRAEAYPATARLMAMRRGEKIEAQRKPGCPTCGGQYRIKPPRVKSVLAILRLFREKSDALERELEIGVDRDELPGDLQSELAESALACPDLEA